MMKRVITMTTNIHAASALDLSRENEVINLGAWATGNYPTLAGVRWTVASSESYDSLVEVFRFTFGLIYRELPSYRIWVLVGNAAWQPDTRIVRYRKLWAALKVRGVEVKHAEDFYEIVKESGCRLKFFGTARLSELSIQSVVEVVLEERCSYLIVLPVNETPFELLEMGWSGDIDDLYLFAPFLFRKSGMAMRVVGEFDDAERGLVAVGPSEIVKILERAST